jgi:hypothetical protein
MSNHITWHVFIEQNDDDSKELTFETSFKKMKKLVTILIDFQIDLKDFILEENQMITFEIIFNRDLRNASMNDQVYIVVLLVSKIIEI